MSARKKFVTFFLVVLLAISLSKNDVLGFERMLFFTKINLFFCYVNNNMTLQISYKLIIVTSHVHSCLYTYNNILFNINKYIYIIYDIIILMFDCICVEPENCLGIQCGPTAHGRYGAYECQKECQGRGFHSGACFIISTHDTQCCCNK